MGTLLRMRARTSIVDKHLLTMFSTMASLLMCQVCRNLDIEKETKK